MSNEIFFGKYQEEGGWHRMWQEEFFECRLNAYYCRHCMFF